MVESLLDLTLKEVEGVPLFMPRLLANNWPTRPLAEFPCYCGSGDGLYEKAVPDSFFGQSQRHNCFIHDVTHTIFSPDRESFHMSNLLLLNNCLSTIRTGSKLLRYPREQCALFYYDVVETEVGFDYYSNGIGGNQGQLDYHPAEDPIFLETLALAGVLDIR